MTMNLEEASALFVGWLEARVVRAARGDDAESIDVEPSGRFWLGGLAPEESVIKLGLNERGERLDPCASGIRIRPASGPPWIFAATVSARVWLRNSTKEWVKSEPLREEIVCHVDGEGEHCFGAGELSLALAKASSADGLACELRVEARDDGDGKPELTVLLVNTSPADHPELKDTRLYECELRIGGIERDPFFLEALPDSFRYDRRVPAYGVNCGVVVENDGTLCTADTVSVARRRPEYWISGESAADLRFETLASDPFPPLERLVEAMESWGEQVWGKQALDDRADRDLWVTAMRAEADAAAIDFSDEIGRVREGIRLLEKNPTLLRSFCLMNEAIAHSAQGKYDGWRPFQIGFLLTNLGSVTNPGEEAKTADIVWFATGGGKTETYLGLIVLAAFHDRITGKTSGMTAWSRFPLRMLSLQQTQRFANAMAGAELVRRRETIEGDPFSSGFLVGMGATPNRIPQEPKKGEPDPEDPEMPAGYQVLLQCPFCFEEAIEMAFDRRHWLLEHRCTNAECSWPESGLPFFVVDQEIYRFLPTVVVGTLDKVASISLQAAMHGLVGVPRGVCSGPRHGYTYAPRSKSPGGCLVPGCTHPVGVVEMAPERFGPSFRLQDELHLLKDSLGAVDAHYEALLDHLQAEACGSVPKILASSATLTGYEKQIEVLYQRASRVFPLPGPSAQEGFWSHESERVARCFVAVAPRGATLEYAVDRTATELQKAVRELVSDPERVCEKTGIDPSHVSDLVSLYGVNVVYGNTLRDLEAVTRSLETQVSVDGSLNTASLTGRTEFEEVRKILQRLEKPEEEFDERLHVISASSMMSHGVDIDRLNVMVMLGLPLGTAEFIQATARIGRRWPGLVFVMHKMARERDAAMYRSFDKFVMQGDRFVEPVPITRRSRRVLERTVAGFQLARILHVHESSGSGALTTVAKLRDHFREAGVTAEAEARAIADALGIEGDLDQPMQEDLARWFEGFFRNLMAPAGTYTFPSELCPLGEPMISLRDVEQQAPIFGLVDR